MRRAMTNDRWMSLRALVLCFGVTVFSQAWAAPAPIPPTVETAPTSSAPPPASDQKLSCKLGPDDLTASPTCPVLKSNGYTYWAYSYIDNRSAMNVVAYDASGQVVKQWSLSGARYLWKISVDSIARTVTFWGQASQTVSLSWDQLVPPPAVGRWALGKVTNNSGRAVSFSLPVPLGGSIDGSALKALQSLGILISDLGVLSVDYKGHNTGCISPAWGARLSFGERAWEFYFDTGTFLDITLNGDETFTFTPGPGGQIVNAGQPAACIR